MLGSPDEEIFSAEPIGIEPTTESESHELKKSGPETEQESPHIPYAELKSSELGRRHSTALE